MVAVPTSSSWAKMGRMAPRATTPCASSSVRALARASAALRAVVPHFSPLSASARSAIASSGSQLSGAYLELDHGGQPEDLTVSRVDWRLTSYKAADHALPTSDGELRIELVTGLAQAPFGIGD